MGEPVFTDDAMPGQMTILGFLGLLEQQALTSQIMNIINFMLGQHGLFFKDSKMHGPVFI